jgi:membrane-bound metal-dependent hydrolase YbcI (DUF457 family)
MFIGHFGVALAARRVAPRPSLGTLVMASLFIDGVWPIFLLLGWEQLAIEPGVTKVVPLVFVSYPYTHSLFAVALWGALFGAVYFAVRRDRNGALWLAALVLSHWVLDAVAHRPDLPLWPGGPKVGLGLWNSLPATLAAEYGLFAAGVAVYATATRPRDRRGTVLFAALVVTLACLHAANVFGPPPPSAQAVAWTGILGWLFVAWAYWISLHRTPAIAH